MSLGEDETIALGPVGALGIVPHEVIVERDHKIRGAEASADVAGVGPVDHGEDAEANLRCLGSERADSLVVYHDPRFSNASLSERPANHAVNYGKGTWGMPEQGSDVTGARASAR